ncbi:CYFA0S01e04258g1_1 [Cyberlindnera fabianii]|uniref:GPI mannosyltransferase 1 n=1 Tax=Cyberlindnera fabianii TaxID=36022 RepID=A0A061AI01_CYBFA|nr:CYFA0S01e04258g1_1 [Cyberlindnera fabianii]
MATMDCRGLFGDRKLGKKEKSPGNAKTTTQHTMPHPNLLAPLTMSSSSKSTWLSMMLTQTNLIAASVAMRLAFLAFGHYQDTHMEVKYTDIDYVVFSDAANYVYHGQSPYTRETYRYTPLLAWMMVPNTLYADFGKIVFVLCDLVTGYIILKCLDLAGTQGPKKTVLSAIWLLNPMVVTISTRGSSESVLTVFVMLFIYLLLKREVFLSGLICGFAVHFKIYPVIYIPTALIFLTNHSNTSGILRKPLSIINSSTMKFSLAAASTFLWFGLLMYAIYGDEFLRHTYIYHFIRTDHRHNFSIYNISLYFTSALASTSQSFDLSGLAFLPQLSLAGIFIPLVFTKKSLTDTFFLQTFVFVTYNKVMTSQYFIWFLIFLPLYLRNSSLISTQKVKGIVCLLQWIISQGSWLYFAYNLEFLGKSTFFPGLLGSASFFFLSNVFLTGVFMEDIAHKPVESKSYI